MVTSKVSGVCVNMFACSFYVTFSSGCKNDHNDMTNNPDPSTKTPKIFYQHEIAEKTKY